MESGRPRGGRIVLPLAAFLACLLLAYGWERLAPIAAPFLPPLAGPFIGRLLRTAAWASAALLLLRLLDVFLWHGLFAGRRGRPPPRLLIDLATALVWLAAAGIIATDVFGWPLVGVVTTSSVAVAVVGFSLRDMLASLFAGLALNLERPFHIGDWIELEPLPAAHVVEIGWLTTRGVTQDGVGIVIPNAKLASQPFRNYSRPEPWFRDSIPVTLGHEIDPDRVQRLLLAAAAEIPALGPPVPAPDVTIGEFGPRGIVWHLRYWVGDNAAGGDLRYLIQCAVLRHLHQAGVSLPYAKLDLFHARMPPRTLDPEHSAEALLARCPIFRGLEDEDRRELAAAARTRHVPADAALLKSGEPGSSLFIVIEGVLDVWRERADGTRLWLNAIGAGATLGEFSLLTGEPRSATVTARRDALLLEIGHEAMAPVLARRPGLVEALGRILAERRERSEMLASLSAASSKRGSREDEGRLGQRIRAFFGL